MASLSDTPRRLGSQSGNLRRAARRIERAGGDPSKMLYAAEEAKLGERSITSADSNIAEQKYRERAQRGLLETQRRALTSGGDNRASYLADLRRSDSIRSGDPAARQRALDRGTALGMTADEIDSEIGSINSPTPRSGATPAPVTSVTPGVVQPPQSFPAPSAPRPSLINGRPAAQTLSGMRSRAEAGITPAPEFGSRVATGNINRLGQEGAVADYQRRAKIADSPVTPPVQEPGNMADVNRTLGIPGVSEVSNVMNTPNPSPLAGAIAAARDRRIAAEQAAQRDAARTQDRTVMTVGGVPVTNDTLVAPNRAPSPTAQSAAPVPAAPVQSVTPPAPETRSFQAPPVPRTSPSLEEIARRKRMEDARKKIGDSATVPNAIRGVEGLEGAFRWLSRPRL